MVKQARAVRTRQSLIRAAAELFADDGYATASLPAISKRAGVSSGALHFHFPNKETLARQVEEAATTSMEQLAARCRSASDSSLQSLVDATSRLLHAAAADPVVKAGVKLCGDPSRKSGSEILRWWRTLVGDLVAQAQAAGELADDVAPEAAASVILAATLGFERLGAWDSEWRSPERLAEFWLFLLPRLAVAPERVRLLPREDDAGSERMPGAPGGAV